MNPRIAGGSLVAAAALFWLSWALMPGVGITDAERILALVSEHRGQVLASVVLQLISAAFYASALVGIPSVRTIPGDGLRNACIVLLIGAMGSAADAIYHLLAHAMTAPGLSDPALVEVMRTMQGPNLVYILPMVAAFFAGSIWLSIAAARSGIVPRWNPLLFVAAMAAAVGGGIAASGVPGAARIVGLTVLALVSTSQALVGIGVATAKAQ